MKVYLRQCGKVQENTEENKNDQFHFTYVMLNMSKRFPEGAAYQLDVQAWS